MLKDLRKQLNSAYRGYVQCVTADQSTSGINALNLAPRYKGLRGGGDSGTCESTCNDSTGRPPSGDNPFGR